MEPKKSSWTSVHTMVFTYWTAWGFSSLDRLLVAMLFPILIPYFKLDYTQAGLIMTSMALGYMVFALLGGILSDKYGRKKVILPSILVFSLGSAISGFATSFAQLIGIRITVGAAEASFNAAAVAQISEEVPANKRGMFVGFYQSAFPLFGSFVAPLYASLVASRLGWQWAFYLTIIPGILVLLITKAKIKESKRFDSPAPTANVSWKEVIKEKNIVLSSLICCFWMAWLWSWLSFGSVYFVNVKGLTTNAAAVLQSAFGAGGFLGMIILPALSDKFGRKLPLIVGTIIGAFGTLTVMFLPSTSYILMYLVFALTAMVVWGYGPIFMSAISTESVSFERAALAVGIVASIGELAGTVIAPPILGMIGDKYGLTSTMYFGVACLIPIIISSFFLRETAPGLVASTGTSTTSI